jgi:hypothetical protein
MFAGLRSELPGVTTMTRTLTIATMLLLTACTPAASQFRSPLDPFVPRDTDEVVAIVTAFELMHLDCGGRMSSAAQTFTARRYNDPRYRAIGSMLQDVSGTSVQEIEKLIAELRILRDRLQKEAARVQHEIVGYAGLIQNARRSARTISGTLGFWRNDRDDTPRISA